MRRGARLSLGIESLESRLLMAQAQGLDVSHWDETINWPVVAASGRSFAFVKATGSDGSNDGQYVDSKFSTNVTGATSAGLKVGVYHFADALSSVSAADQAKYFVDHAANYMKPGNLPPVADVEVGGGTLSIAAFSQWVNDFNNYIFNRTGVRPIIYASTNYCKNFVDTSVAQWPLWIANWPTTPNSETGDPAVGDSNSGWPASSWKFWQYAGDTGSVPGVPTACDMDVYHGTVDEMLTMLITVPEVTVTQGAAGITDGQAGTVNFGSVNVGSAGTSITFTVKNDGGSLLTLATPTLPSGYSITEPLATSLPAGVSDSFTVHLDTGSSGTKSGNISVTTNDSDENPFNFPVTGAVNSSVPDITVLQGATNITDGQATAINFGTVNIGSAGPSITFTVRNDGGTTLSLVNMNLPAGYTVTDTLAGSLAAGASDNFTIQLDTSTTGTKAGDIVIVSNDGDENPFNFAITGSVIYPIPAAPTSLAVTGFSSNSVSLSWTDNSSNETGFIIERRTGASGSFAQVGSTGPNVATFTDSGVSGPQPSTTYFYHVRAANVSTTSNPTNDVIQTTYAATPADLSATDGAFHDHVSLNWSAASGATKYRIYRSTTNDPATASALTDSMTTSFDDFGANPDVTYFYWAASLNTANVPGAKSTGDPGFADNTAPAIVEKSFDASTAPLAIKFKFSEPVTGLSQNSLAILNLDGGAVPAILGFSYNPQTLIATWTVSSTLEDANFAASLSGAADAAGNSLAAPSGQSFSYLRGDVNSDRVVNSLDFNALAQHFNQTAGVGYLDGDFNYDGVVNGLDFNALATRFGHPLPASPALVAAAPIASLFSDTGVGSDEPDGLGEPVQQAI